MANITDPKLNVAKQKVLGDINKLKKFEACQLYLKTVHQNDLSTHTARTARNVLSVQTNDRNHRDNNKRYNGRRNRNNYNSKRQKVNCPYYVG
jgi:hypothetical protein